MSRERHGRLRGTELASPTRSLSLSCPVLGCFCVCVCLSNRCASLLLQTQQQQPSTAAGRGSAALPAAGAGGQEPPANGSPSAALSLPSLSPPARAVLCSRLTRCMPKPPPVHVHEPQCMPSCPKPWHLPLHVYIPLTCPGTPLACFGPPHTPNMPWQPAHIAAGHAARAGCAGVLRGMQVCSKVCPCAPGHGLGWG